MGKVDRGLVANYMRPRFEAAMSAMLGLVKRKHDHYADFGWPEQLTFADFHRMYSRNSLAKAGVRKTRLKTWQDDPEIWEDETGNQTPAERQIAEYFTRIRVWHSLALADERSMVGRYAGVILRFADGKNFDQPVGQVSGLEGLVEVIPVWEGQLTVSSWHNNPIDWQNYGQPKMFTYRENAVGQAKGSQQRDVNIHPDRIIIWSEDGSMEGESALQAGFNDLIDAEKVKGAGGEGFWKSARGAPIIEAPDGVKPQDVAKALGLDKDDTNGVLDAINDQIESFQQGFDKGLMLGGLKASPMTIALPQPEQFFNAPTMSFAASLGIPIKILLGSQTGERASTEDSKEWNTTIMARRLNYCAPLIRKFVARLVQFGVLEDKNWTVGWADLTEATPSERMTRAKDMATINNTQAGSVPKAPPAKTDDGERAQQFKENALDDPLGQPASQTVFTIDEIREAAGYKGLDRMKKSPYDKPNGTQPGAPTNV